MANKNEYMRAKNDDHILILAPMPLTSLAEEGSAATTTPRKLLLLLFSLSDGIIQIALAIQVLGNYQHRLVVMKAFDFTTHSATLCCSLLIGCHEKALDLTRHSATLFYSSITNINSDFVLFTFDWLP